MADKLAFIKFFPNDWLNDEVAGCSLAAQGLWLRMMIVMHHSTPYGHLAQRGGPMPPETIAAKCGCTPGAYATLYDELYRHGVPSVTASGIIFSRRMVRDHHNYVRAVRAGRKGGNPQLLEKKKGGGVNPPVNPASDSDSESGISEGGGAGGGNGRRVTDPAMLGAMLRKSMRRKEGRR